MRKLFTLLLIIVFSYGFSYTDKKEKKEKPATTVKKETKPVEKKTPEVKSKPAEPAFHPLMFIPIER